MVHKSSRDAQIAHDQELRVHRLQLGILNPSTVEDAEHWSSAGILERLAELGATPAQLAALERYQPEASPTIVIDVERAVRLCNELLLEPAEKSDSFNKSTTVTADSLLSAAVAVPQPSPYTRVQRVTAHSRGSLVVPFVGGRIEPEAIPRPRFGLAFRGAKRGSVNPVDGLSANAV